MGDNNKGDVKFKRAFMGGFKRAAVIAYIEQLQRELFECRNECERTVQSAREQSELCDKQAADLRAESAALTQKLNDELEQATKAKQEYQKLCDELQNSSNPSSAVLAELSCLRSELSMLRSGCQANAASSQSHATPVASTTPAATVQLKPALKAETDRIAELVAKFTV